jgi:hypothetical protein
MYIAQPVTKLTKPEWKTLNKKQQWDVLVALRGPDWASSKAGYLKWLTTGVIRERMWGLLKPEGGSATRNQEMNWVTVPNTSKSLAPNFDSAHFLGHVRDATHILGLSKLELPHETFVAAISADNPREIIRDWFKTGVVPGHYQYYPDAIRIYYGLV